MATKYLSVFLEPRVHGTMLQLHQAGEQPIPFKNHNSVSTVRIGNQLRLVGSWRNVLKLIELSVRVKAIKR